MNGRPYIRCRGLEKAFGAKPVLRGLTLDVPAGETLVVLGGSGSGKSVLLKHMNALLLPDAGEVEVDGVVLQGLDEDALVPVRRNVAMLFQQGALFDSLTVGENIAYPLREHRLLPPGAIPGRVRQALEMVDLAGSERLMPAELSGGMRKRAARLDPVVAAKINHLIRDLQRRLGVSSVVVTHDLGSAFLVADRIAFLHEGRIRFIGTPDEARASRDPFLHEFLNAA